MLYSGRKFFELRMVFRPTWKSAVTVNVQFLWVACCIANSHPCLIPQQVQQFLSMHMFFPQCFIFKLPESETTPTWCQRRGSRKFKISISFCVRYVFKYSYILWYPVCAHSIFWATKLQRCGPQLTASPRPPRIAPMRVTKTQNVSVQKHTTCDAMIWHMNVVDNFAMIWCPLQHHKKTVFVFLCMFSSNKCNLLLQDRPGYIYIYI